MFARDKRIGPYTYVYLVENVREEGRTKQRIIANLGRKEVVVARGDLDRLAAPSSGWRSVRWCCRWSRAKPRPMQGVSGLDRRCRSFGAQRLPFSHAPTPPSLRRGGGAGRLARAPFRIPPAGSPMGCSGDGPRARTAGRRARAGGPAAPPMSPPCCRSSTGCALV